MFGFIGKISDNTCALTCPFLVLNIIAWQKLSHSSHSETAVEYFIISQMWSGRSTLFTLWSLSCILYLCCILAVFWCCLTLRLSPAYFHSCSVHYVLVVLYRLYKTLCEAFGFMQLPQSVFNHLISLPLCVLNPKIKIVVVQEKVQKVIKWGCIYEVTCPWTSVM